MSSKLAPLPGTSDIWEPDVCEWITLEAAARDVFARYGYGELRTPIFERTSVFVRTIGDETDVVQKEMYTFADRGGRSLTLRPEGTAGVMRAIANRGIAQGEERRVFYMGPMFRGEKPAAGRRRQFHQIGVEAVGACTPAGDAECMAMLVDYLDAVGIADARVLINTRGMAADKERVETAFREFFAPHKTALCKDCQRRLDTNVSRILDCKIEGCQETIQGAPAMVDIVGDESRAFFTSVCAVLDAIGISYRVDPRLVRGLDYYVHTVFEVVHSGLGAQDALAGGGRYEIGLPGSKHPLQGVGFAAGMERLLMARESLGVHRAAALGAQVFVAGIGAPAVNAGLALAQQIRRRGVAVIAEQQGRSMKAQMRTANKLGVRLAVIRGETELANATAICRDMQSAEQQEVPLDDLADLIVAKLG